MVRESGEATADGGGRDRVRRILHCDMDSFYAAVHVRDDPSLAGVPLVIGGDPSGRGVVASASYPAREYGIRSAMPAARALRLCPRAVFLKPDFPRYRRESRRIFAIFRELTPLVQPVSIDEAYLDVSDHLEPWGSATAVAEEVRRRVRGEVGLTVSVGVGPSKLVAKIASDAGKPDGLTVVKPHSVRAFLDPLPARSIPGVGPRTAEKLAELGVERVHQLAALDEALLVERFGRHGRAMHRYARGVDERPVSTERERKSLSCERTYSRDLAELAEMDEELERLAASVARGLEKRDLAGSTVTVKVRYADFTTLTRSLTLPAPVAGETVLAACARDLLRRTRAGERRVRLLGVGVSNLVEGGPRQLWLFSAREGGR